MQREVFNQVNQLTTIFIRHSICIHQNFPKKKSNEIVWNGYKNISFSLKNIEYEELYKQCLKEEEYNFLLIDGALVQLMYRFDKKNIDAHRLAFYPNPLNERYQDNPEEFEEIYFGAELFTEILDNNVISVPIRIDFDSDEEKYLDCDHPYSHLTIGNYKNCRIPISSPITPFRFMDFILRNFYYDKYNDILKKAINCSIKVERTISKDEAKLLHLNYTN